MKNRRLWVSILAGFLAFIMIFGIVAMVIPASAASSSEIKKQIEAMEKKKKEQNAQIAALKKQQNNNLNEMKGLVAEKQSIDQQVQILYQQIDVINEQLAAYNVLIADKQKEVDAAEAHLVELNQKYKERIRAMEEDGELSYWSVLFKANSFSDLLDRINMVEEIAASDQRRLKELKIAAEEVAAAQQELIQEKAALKVAREELEASEKELIAKREEADLLLAAMKEKGDEFEKLIQQSEDKVEDTLAELGKLNDDYDKAKYEEWLAAQATANTVKPGVAQGSNVGGVAGTLFDTGWMTPCNYSKVSSGFGMRLHPVYKVWKLHKGVDLAADKGEPIYASKGGQVTVAGWDSSGGGNYVKIAHGKDDDGNTWGSAYLHMTNYIVKAGDFVQQGQLIGYVGSTGVSTGPHLHFTIYKNNVAVNPMLYIGK